MIRLMVLFSLFPSAVQTESPRTPRDVVGKFVEHVGHEQKYPEAARQFVARQWELRRDGTDLHTFIPEVLAVLYPRFRAGLEAFEARQFEYCARVMGEMSLSPDLYLAAYAALLQSKALVEEVEFEYAALVLDYSLRPDFDLEAYCLDAVEMKFLQGYSLFHMFEADAARESLEGFLSDHPDARPELRASAREMLDHLSPPPRKTLGQVAHLMADAGLWLTEGHAGLETQTSQKKAMMILEEMVRRAEQQENQQQQQQQAQGGGSQNPQSARAPQAPANASTAPGGEATTGSLHAAPHVTPGEVWGQMKPQDRDRIMQTLQQNFPSRYRQMVEQYYRAVAQEDE